MRSRIAQLDGLRGLAILFVLVWHTVSAPWGYTSGVAGSLPRGPLALAWCGVDLFFVLSGYLIADILLQARHATNAYRVFLFRRACRLLPLYLLSLVGYVVASVMLAGEPVYAPLFQPDSPPLWSYCLLMQNLGMAWQNHFGPGWLAVTWSLAVEWQFYLLFPLFVRYVPHRLMPCLAFLGIAISPLVRMMLPSTAGYVSLISRADAFLAGALVAYVLHEPLCTHWLRTHRNLVRIAVGICLFGTLIMMAKPEAFGAVTPWYGSFTHTWLALSFAIAILHLLTEETGWLSRRLQWPALRGLGTISYGIYLFHQPVHRLLFGVIQDREPTLENTLDAILTLTSWLTTIMLATAAYFTLERYFITQGRRAKYSSASDTPMPRVAIPNTVSLPRQW
jgi:peptidoglycan/LPS O-acetylase OafA/YrhL